MGINKYKIMVDGKPYEEFVSVTTICDMMDKPALKKWLMGMALDYVKSYASEYASIDALVADAATKGLQKSSEALDIGSEVHRVISQHIEFVMSGQKTKPVDVDELHDEVKNCFDAFRAWEAEALPEYIAQERVVVHSGTPPYAGTLDCIARINGLVTVLDWKTSTGIWDEYLLQVAAYAVCDIDVSISAERTTDAGTVKSNYAPILDLEIQQAGIVRLDKQSGEFETKYLNRVQIDRKSDCFLSLSNAWWLMKDRQTENQYAKYLKEFYK